jgi:hypothetical protein
LRRSLRRTTGARNARRAFDTEPDHDYDGEDDGAESPSGSERSGHSRQSGGSEGVEKKAAWLLMNLSVREGAWAAASTDAVNAGASSLAVNAGNAIGAGTGLEAGGREARPQITVDIPADFAPRVKRRRATSL